MAKPKDSWLKKDPHGVLDIPISKYSVVEHIHPEFARRVNQAAKDPRIKGTFVVVSGERSYAAQKDLYERYVRWKRTKRGKKANMAANPDYKHSDGTVGSRHQVQRDGFAYALDFDITYGALVASGKKLGISWKSKENQRVMWGALHDVMLEYGVGFPIKDHPTFPERWHAQPFKKKDAWYPILPSWSLETAAMKKEGLERVTALVTEVAETKRRQLEKDVSDVIEKVPPKPKKISPPWYQQEVNEAILMGITNGARPSETATRAEAILFAKRAAEYAVERSK